jgi:hypothetical protein
MQIAWPPVHLQRLYDDSPLLSVKQKSSEIQEYLETSAWAMEERRRPLADWPRQTLKNEQTLGCRAGASSRSQTALP